MSPMFIGLKIGFVLLFSLGLASAAPDNCVIYRKGFLDVGLFGCNWRPNGHNVCCKVGWAISLILLDRLNEGVHLLGQLLAVETMPMPVCPLTRLGLWPGL